MQNTKERTRRTALRSSTVAAGQFAHLAWRVVQAYHRIEEDQVIMAMRMLNPT